MEESDLNLVKRIQNGDKDAFRLLVERYQRKVFSIAYGMVHNREDAMDLTQDAFLKVFNNLGQFEGSSSFYTWLYRIAINVSIDHIRRSGRHVLMDYDDRLLRDEDASPQGSILPSTLGMDPGRNLSRKELLEQIERALKELSPIHKEAILLREIQGLSYEEMAEVMGVSKGTVMSRLHHARRNLQARLKDYVDEKAAS